MHSSDSLAATLARYGDLVDGALRRLFDAHAGPADFYGIMRYHLGWVDERFVPLVAGRGKGLRGALLMLVHGAFGGDDAMAAPLAAGIELLHNFSLVHDDFEDGSLIRRHRPAVWSVWGAPVGINAGDGMFALAHLALFASPLRHESPERFIDVVRRFDTVALRVCEGQHLDMTFERAPEVTVAQYLEMIGGKSAALIAAAACIGARAAGAEEDRVQAAYRFGYDLGMAFQMQDDILGIWGDEAMTGKSASSDVASRKKTLPILLALEHATPADHGTLRSLYARTSDDDEGTRAILAVLDRAGAHDRARDYLRRYGAAALDALREAIPLHSAREQVDLFARQFIDRVA